MVYNCFTVKSVFIPKQLLLTYKIRHYSFQVFTGKLVESVKIQYLFHLTGAQAANTFYCKKQIFF